MKNKKIKSAGLFLLSAMMLTGLNAQSSNWDGQGHRYGQRQWHGQGQCLGQGQWHGQRQDLGQGLGQERFGREFGPRHQRIAQHLSLDLSEDQMEEMKVLRSEHYKTMKPLRNKNLELKAKQRTLLSEENVKMKAVNLVIDEQTDLMNKIKKLQVEHHMQVKSILTDEQVMKFEQRRKFTKHRRGNYKSVD